MILTGETKVLERKPVLMPLRLPQIPDVSTWHRTYASRSLISIYWFKRPSAWIIFKHSLRTAQWTLSFQLWKPVSYCSI